MQSRVLWRLPGCPPWYILQDLVQEDQLSHWAQKGMESSQDEFPWLFAHRYSPRCFFPSTRLITNFETANILPLAVLGGYTSMPYVWSSWKWKREITFQILFIAYCATNYGVPVLVLYEEWFTVECPANLVRVPVCAGCNAVPDLVVDLKVDLTLFNGLTSHVYPRLSDVEPWRGFAVGWALVWGHLVSKLPQGRCLVDEDVFFSGLQSSP